MTTAPDWQHLLGPGEHTALRRAISTAYPEGVPDAAYRMALDWAIRIRLDSLVLPLVLEGRVRMRWAGDEWVTELAPPTAAGEGKGVRLLRRPVAAQPEAPTTPATEAPTGIVASLAHRYDLSRIGRQIATGEIDERGVLAWVWIYGTNGGRRFTFEWATDARYIFPGGPTQLRSALETLSGLGWIAVSEEIDAGRCTVIPTPGDALVAA